LRNLLKPLRDLNDATTLCKYLESFYTLRKVMVYAFFGFG
jgi:squalene monooxygenase